jgi:major intracellular serine protease
MPLLRVTVPRLNKRKSVPRLFPDKNGITGEVFENFIFEGEEVVNLPNPDLGKWYKDREGFFYWAGGVEEKHEVIKSTKIAEGKDWWYSHFKIDQLSAFSKGENIKLAILDSGLDFNSKHFQHKKNIHYYNAYLDSSTKDDCFDNDSGHGTNCAGIVCASGAGLAGVAPDVELVVIKITNQHGSRDTKAFLRGLAKAIELKCAVISVSFQMRRDEHFEAIHNAIKKAYGLDISVVASVGNSGGLKPIDTFPASFPECLSIGGINKTKIRSNASNQSNFLDLMGPGEEISSFTEVNQMIDGTSYSAPFVGAAIAAIKSAAKKNGRIITNVELYDLLKRSADKQITNYNSLEYGFGIIDPIATLQLLNTI